MSEFAERTTGVHGYERGTGRTVSHDNDIYKYVIWEWLDSLKLGWSSVDHEAGLEVFRIHTAECITLSSLDDDLRDAIDNHLRSIPGYVGAFQIDPGNPVHRRGFFDLLIYAAAISNGAVIQELSFEGNQDWPLDGSEDVKPAGSVWQPYGWLALHGPARPSAIASLRGQQAATAVKRKQTLSVELRVLDEISNVILQNDSRTSFDFKAIGTPTDILQALLPEGKFTKYLLDRTHPKGGSKATFLIDFLGIDPEDWRYLAGQFYFGLLMARPEDVKIIEWETGIAARFNVLMRVRNRTGTTVAIETGWNMVPGAMPSLSTAFPGQDRLGAVEPGDPPILPPGPRTKVEWSNLWSWANLAGQDAANNHVPTPMFLSGVGPVAEGECGTALVRVFDARRGFARWLRQAGVGETDGYGGVVTLSPIQSQSLERASTWARTVAAVLQLNGVDANIQLFKT
ncbi:DUF6883 domain-containing protein [Pseudotabrizicola alkalilacus]|uniref:DUF6883 domain-containing protein n=1 Tax=Pseudotabrizicola alkalilacus TaxID=2305252 RepID=UPI0011C19306|nr:DUF6883 domain-containing protein [Pseudotabrizicola alkalilacus]